jgi:hypothetical protein
MDLEPGLSHEGSYGHSDIGIGINNYFRRKREIQSVPPKKQSFMINRDISSSHVDVHQISDAITFHGGFFWPSKKTIPKESNNSAKPEWPMLDAETVQDAMSCLQRACN